MSTVVTRVGTCVNPPLFPSLLGSKVTRVCVSWSQIERMGVKAFALQVAYPQHLEPTNSDP